MENHFMEYNDILNKIVEVQTRIIEIKEKMYNVKGVSYGDAPKGGSNNIDIVFFLTEIEELELELYALNNKKTTLKKKHEEEIDKIKNEKYRSILRMYFIYKMNKFTIADTLNISLGYLSHLKKKAIEEFVSININKYQ